MLLILSQEKNYFMNIYKYINISFFKIEIYVYKYFFKLLFKFRNVYRYHIYINSFHL